MVLIIDPRMAGISGDMMLSALVDMGAAGVAPRIMECVKFLDGSAIDTLKFVEERRGGIKCTRMVLETRDPHSRPAEEMTGAVHDAASYLGLSSEAAAFADRCIECMVSCEAMLHADGAHLHESGSVDTLLDIAGTALAMDMLSLAQEDKIVMPVNVGSGTATFSHGTFSNPVPAVLEILRQGRIPMSGSSIDAETTTPTGACILAGLQARAASFYPGMVAVRTGRGAGSRNLDGVPNMLTIVQGEQSCIRNICVLESSIDDATGETLARTISRAMEMGAADASAYPGTGKKGRPTNLLAVLCESRLSESIADMIVEETGTLGVRISTTERYVVPREIKRFVARIDGTDYTLRYKMRRHRGQEHFKIESDDIDRIAKNTGISGRRIEKIARRQIEDHIRDT